MRATTLVRMAFVGGRTDTLRVIFTAVTAALGVLALLAAATVTAIPELGPEAEGSDSWNIQYSNPLLREPGLRPGVVTALLLVALPVLALAGQGIRFGSPARDRRLAALRLAGATPRQTVLVAAAETAIAALVGTLLGLGGYLVGRALLDRPNAQGKLGLPTDVLPSAPWIVGIVLLVPVLAAFVGVVLLRRVLVTPLGVFRRTRERTPRLWPAVLLIGAALALAAIRLSSGKTGNSAVIGVYSFALVVLAMIGVIVGTGWIAWMTGVLLRRFGRRPAMLIAGRHLQADPWSGSRTSAALLTGAIIGAGVISFRAVMVTQATVNTAYQRLIDSSVERYADDNFYLRSLDLVDAAIVVALALAAAGIMVALAEGIVMRRRGYAALVATGVPRRTLGEAIAWQTLAPLVPALALAMAIGVNLTPVVGTTVSSGTSDIPTCVGTAAQCADPAYTQWVDVPGPPAVTMRVPVPFGDLSVFGGGVLAALLVIVGVGLVFLRMSTHPEELRTA